MSFYSNAARIALGNSNTKDEIRLMYEKCLTYVPGDFEHRVLLYEDGRVEHHRIMIGSNELSAVKRGSAVAFVKTRQFDKSLVEDIEKFIKVNVEGALRELKKLANS